TRIHNDMRVNPAFLFAVMFWYPLLETAQKIAQESGLAYYDAFALAIFWHQRQPLFEPRLEMAFVDGFTIKLDLPTLTGHQA
ncbi:hypothetical protein VXE41_23230, partial [Acinetobacter variabilis]